PEFSPNRDGAGKPLLHFIRLRIGRDIDIFGLFPQEGVPDATACEISDKAALPEATYKLRRHQRKRIRQDHQAGSDTEELSSSKTISAWAARLADAPGSCSSI